MGHDGDVDNLPLLSTQAIRDALGSADAVELGEDYLARGKLVALDWAPRVSRVSGAVKGSRGRGYLATATFSADGGSVTDTSCTCSWGGGCKHVAALLLEVRRRGAEQTLPTMPSGGGPPHPRFTPTPAWRKLLAPLSQAPVLPAGSRDQPGATEFGLQFRVNDIGAARGSLAQPTAGGVSLSIRPVKQTAKGWADGYDARWPSRYDRNYNRSWGWAWLADLASASSDYYRSSQWLPLNDFSGGLLWLLLAQGQRAGVPFVGTTPGQRIVLAERMDCDLDVRRVPSGLVAGRRLVVDGEPFDADVVGAVGGGGLFGVSFGEAPTIVVGPTARPLVEGDIALVKLREVSVAAGDVDDFMASVYPSLRRRFRVVSSDGSVDFPAPATPVLVADVAYPDVRTADVMWYFEYGGQRRPYVYIDDDVRDFDAEQALLDGASAVTVPVVGARPAEHQRFEGLDAIAFARAVPALEAVEGVVVRCDGEAPVYREADAAPLVAVSVGEGDDPDWFDLGIKVSVEGREVPFAPLFAAIARGDEWLILDDGTLLRTDLPVFAHLRELIAEARRLTDRPGALRLNRYAASLWGEFEELADMVDQAASWQASAGALFRLAAGGASPQPVPLPTGLRADLRPYQVGAYEWLAFLRRHQLGGILADDMGLGKTVEVLALIAHAVEEAAGPQRPFLVVAPASVVANWYSEAARFVPGLRTTMLPTTIARSGVPFEDVVAQSDIVVTSYAIFRLDFEHFSSLEWAGLILDEAQFLKNPKTRANECARLLRTPFKLAMTGTPMENSLTELWAILAVVAPGLFPSVGRFREDYVASVNAGVRARQALKAADAGGVVGYGAHDRAVDEDIARAADATLARLRRRVKPLLLRRTKEQVAPELPERIEQELAVELAPRHRRIYDTLLQRERSRVLGLLDDYQANRFEIFRSLMLLRRAALDISLIDEKYDGIPSAKLDILFEQIEEVTATGHRALVFSQFTTFLAKIAQRAQARNVAYEYLDGATRQRAKVIDRFRDGDAPLFLISLKAGGFGLNLTQADYVFLMDPWWNPATENQAIDRTHRIGQTRNVMVFRLVSSGTIEDKVMALKARKAQLFNAVLDDDSGAFAQSLQADDIRGLFEAG